MKNICHWHLVVATCFTALAAALDKERPEGAFEMGVTGDAPVVLRQGRGDLSLFG